MHNTKTTKEDINAWLDSEGCAKQPAQLAEEKEAQKEWVRNTSDADLVKYYYDNTYIAVVIPAFLWGEDALQPYVRAQYYARAAAAHRLNRKVTMFSKFTQQVKNETQELRLLAERFTTTLGYYLISTQVDKLLERETIPQGLEEFMHVVINSTAQAYKYISVDAQKQLVAGEPVAMYFDATRLLADCQGHAERCKNLVEGCKTAIKSARDVTEALQIGHLVEKEVTAELAELERQVKNMQLNCTNLLKQIEEMCKAYGIDVRPTDKKEKSLAAMRRMVPTWEAAKIYKKVYANNVADYGGGNELSLEPGNAEFDEQAAFVCDMVREYNEAKTTEE